MGKNITSARRKLLTLHAVVIGWTVLCTSLWLVAVVDAALDEAACHAEGGWFCGPGAAAVIGGVVYFFLFAFGLIPIAIGWMLSKYARARR